MLHNIHWYVTMLPTASEGEEGVTSYIHSSQKSASNAIISVAVFTTGKCRNSYKRSAAGSRWSIVELIWQIFLRFSFQRLQYTKHVQCQLRKLDLHLTSKHTTTKWLSVYNQYLPILTTTLPVVTDSYNYNCFCFTRRSSGLTLG